MFEHIKSLSEDEKELVLNAPFYVSALIAGADGDISNAETKRIAELIHIKTFSEKYELRELYKTLDHDVAQEFRKLLATMPEGRTERNEFLVDKLTRLNKVFPKLEPYFAVRLYKNLREFADYVGHVDGGFWGIGSMTTIERGYVKLPMLQDPADRTEEDAAHS